LLAVARRTLPRDLQPKAGCSDLVQDTLLAAWAGRDRAPVGSDAMRAWLRGILRKHVGRLHRRYVTAAKRSIRFEQSLDSQQAEPGEAADGEAMLAHDEVVTALREAVGRLQPYERIVLVGRLDDGLSWRQIAALLGTTEEGARKVFVRTLARLRRRIGSRFDPNPG
jgi:RNA polymerase sigma factor (sigma-70 family)